MANGRRGDTVPLMGLLGQIEKKKNRDVVEVDNLMKSFQDLAKEQDSIEGYESAKKSITNLPDVNAFVKAKKGIMLKQLDNEIKSQQTFNSLQTQINGMYDKIQKDPTENFKDLITDITVDIANNQNVLPQQEIAQLNTLLQSLDSYSEQKRTENLNENIAQNINTEGENNPYKFDVIDRQEYTYVDIVKDYANLKGDASVMVNMATAKMKQKERQQNAQLKAINKSDQELSQYANVGEQNYKANMFMLEKLDEAAQNLATSTRTGPNRNKFVYTRDFRTEGLAEGSTDPDFFLKQAHLAANVLHSFVQDEKGLQEGFKDYLSKAGKTIKKKDDQDRWTKDYIKKITEYLEKSDPENYKNNPRYGRRVEGLIKGMGLEERRGDFSKNIVDLYSTAKNYYTNSLILDELSRMNKTRGYNEMQSNYQSSYNIMQLDVGDD